MKTRYLTRKQFATELARAAHPENPYFPASRVATARELLGDGMWAQSHYYTPEIDPQSLADAWTAAESRWTQNVVAMGPLILKIPRKPPRPIRITN